MKLINAAFAAKKINEAELPAEIKLEIRDLQDAIAKYNEACDLYEEEEFENKETESRLDKMEEGIVSTERGIVSKIEAHADAKAQEAAAAAAATQEAADAEKAAQEAAAEAERVAQEAAAEAEKVAQEADKKGSSGLGWLLLAGAVALVTFGAVNMNKK